MDFKNCLTCEFAMKCPKLMAKLLKMDLRERGIDLNGENPLNFIANLKKECEEKVKEEKIG